MKDIFLAKKVQVESRTKKGDITEPRLLVCKDWAGYVWGCGEDTNKLIHKLELDVFGLIEPMKTLHYLSAWKEGC